MTLLIRERPLLGARVVFALLDRLEANSLRSEESLVLLREREKAFALATARQLERIQFLCLGRSIPIYLLLALTILIRVLPGSRANVLPLSFVLAWIPRPFL